MIYTIGVTKIYLSVLDGTKPVHKLRGGVVFPTEQDAKIYLKRTGLSNFSVFGVEADWDTDTKPNPSGEWRDLTRDALVVKLDK